MVVGQRKRRRKNKKVEEKKKRRQKKRKMGKLLIFLSIVAISLMLIFISGQAGCGQKEETKFDSSALTMSFVAEAPPSQVNYGQKFPIYIDVKNTGGYDVAEAKATFFLSGTGNNLKNVETKLSNSVLLTKKTKTVEGATERIKFAEQAEPAIQLQNPFTLNMNIDSCYDYATLVQTSICVGKSNSICKIEGNKIAATSNTAAPLQVTSLTERTEGNKLYVEFLIENKGKGIAYLPTSDCEKLQINDINEIQKKDMAEIVVRSDSDFS